MTKEEFIQLIGEKAKKDYQKSGVLASITIAQACLESGYGQSELAKKANNLFGMKTSLSGNNWKSVWDGSKYNVLTKEEDQKRIQIISADFRKYPSIDKSIEDHSLYLTQAQIGNQLRYKGLIGERSYKKVAEIIKKGGYATSSTYISILCSLIEKWNLTQYDIKGGNINMSNSPLVDYVKISPNKNSPRNNKIKKITIHHMAGNMTIENCLYMFSLPSRKASCNYCIGTDGRVGLGVDERDRAWTSSSGQNDHQAITIEVANDSGAPNWHVSDEALAKLIDLCVDICKRNNIEKLNFTGDKTGNLTMHKWFAPTGCPGPYLESKFPYIAEEVNKRLGIKSNTITKPTQEIINSNVTSNIDKSDIVKLTPDAVYYNGKTIPQWVKNKTWIVKDINEDKAIIDKSQDGKNSICSPINTKFLTKIPSTFRPYVVKITADILNIRKGPSEKYPVVGYIKDKGKYTIIEEKNKFGRLKSGAGWIDLKYTQK